MTQSTGSGIRMTDIQFLPRCIVVLIDVSYTHCKVTHALLHVQQCKFRINYVWLFRQYFMIYRGILRLMF